MTAQNFAIQHARQHDIVGEFCLTGAFRPGIDLAKWLADYLEWFAVVVFFAYPHIGPEISRRFTRIHADQKGSKKHSSIPGFQIRVYLRSSAAAYSYPYKLSRGSSIASPRIRAAANSTAS